MGVVHTVHDLLLGSIAKLGPGIIDLTVATERCCCTTRLGSASQAERKTRDAQVRV